MITFLLKFIRFLCVRDRVLTKKYVLNQNSYKIERSKGLPVYNRRGGSLAQYAGRFVLISANDFSTVLMGEGCDESQLLKKYPGLNNKDDIDTYIDTYYEIVSDFYNCYNSKKEQDIEAIHVFNEEFSHHKLIRDTPTYVILNSLTVYYRICSSYLTYYRYHNKDMDMTVSEALLNTYLIRSYITNITYPIVEASYHYREDLTEVETMYGNKIKEWCNRFNIIATGLSLKCVKDEVKNELLQLVQSVFLSFPYISAIISTKIDLIKFVNLCEDYFIAENEALYEEIIKRIKSKDFREDELKDYLMIERNKRTSNTQLDRKYYASLLYLATETSENFIPRSLIKFIFKRIPVCKNKYVLCKILFKKKDVDDAYKDFPPIKCVGFKNQFICIDWSMDIFKGKSFIIAQNSFEPTLVGENGYINLADSPICRPLLIQALLIKSLSLMIFIDDDDFDENKFRIEFSQLLSNMPNEHKDWIEKDILDLFYNHSKEILKGFTRIQDVDMGIVAQRFEDSIINLQRKINMYPEDKKESFYTFCDVNYVHGF